MSRPGSKVDPARLAAYDVLAAVRDQDAYTNLVLPPLLRERGLSGRDAAFVTELVSGTIRGQGSYDAVIAANIDRPLDKVDAPVLAALRLGTHQLLAMRVPSHAAVGTTVDLVRSQIGHGPSGFVNAVLRKVSRHDLEGWLRRVAPDPVSDPDGYSAVTRSHPRWVVEALREALGARAEELDALLEADNAAPRVTLVARPGVSTVEELVAAGGEVGRSPHAVILTGGDPGAIAAVRDGRAGVQDEGSQVVATALVTAGLDGRDQRWLDVCAGPGGKSALLAALARPRGARVVASERQEHRARLVARATRRSGAGLAGVLTADGTQPPWAEETFDRVLVDAPVHRARGAASSSGGPLAPSPARRRTARATAGGPARRCARLGTTGWGGGLRDLLAGPRRDGRRRRVRAGGTRRRTPRGGGGPGAVRRRRGPARGHGAAVAAPARHGCDVPRPAAAHLTRLAGSGR